MLRIVLGVIAGFFDIIFTAQLIPMTMMGGKLKTAAKSKPENEVR